MLDQGMNDAPSSEVKHWALEKVPPSASTLTTPLCWMNSRPLVALHKSTGTKTLVPGRKFAGRVNGTEFVPLVAMAPLRWTIPEMPRTAALEVAKGALVQPFFSVRLVKNAGALANEAPSSEVKHWALEKVPPSASTSTTPLGAMCSRPLVALHRSTLT